MTSRDLLLDLLDCAFDHRSWHGPNLGSSLRGVSAARAARRVKGRKAIWEQALHAAYWKQRVLNQLAGTQRFPRRGSNWPPAPQAPTQAAWRRDVMLLRDIHRRLRETVAALPARRLDRKTIWLVHGAAAHDLYHAGQINLLKRMSARG
ncbi:MAG: DinB family protein [Tepidisphaeraceae bacterium]